IVDSHAFMLGLRGEVETQGAAVAFRSPLLAGHVVNGAIELEVGGREPVRLLARSVVNSAGLFAQDVARSIEGFPAERIPPKHYCKGNYFGLAGRSPFSRLVYPAPEAAGLGVHLTLDLAGQARFGPDVEWVERIDYDVDPERSAAFYGAIRSYWPPRWRWLPPRGGRRPNGTCPRPIPTATFTQRTSANSPMKPAGRPAEACRSRCIRTAR